MICFKISREEQLRRLKVRDGKSSDDAEQLIDCINENLLDLTDVWDLNIVAEGDFKELAKNLHQLSEKTLSFLGTSYVLAQDSMKSQEVV